MNLDYYSYNPPTIPTTCKYTQGPHHPHITVKLLTSPQYYEHLRRGLAPLPHDYLNSSFNSSPPSPPRLTDAGLDAIATGELRRNNDGKDMLVVARGVAAPVSMVSNSTNSKSPLSGISLVVVVIGVPFLDGGGAETDVDASAGDGNGMGGGGGSAVVVLPCPESPIRFNRVDPIPQHTHLLIACTQRCLAP